jgi:hypothetical protein
MAASVNPVLSAPAPSEASGILVAKTQATAVYQLPPPGTPFGLAVACTTPSTATLSWSAPSSGGLPASYIVQVSAHGADIWSTAGTVTARQPATQ